MIITKTIKLKPDLVGITLEQKEHGAYIVKHNLIDGLIQEVKKHVKFDYQNIEDAPQDEEGNYLLTASIEIIK
jgi:hypothetical protein